MVYVPYVLMLYTLMVGVCMTIGIPYLLRCRYLCNYIFTAMGRADMPLYAPCARYRIAYLIECRPCVGIIALLTLCIPSYMPHRCFTVYAHTTYYGSTNALYACYSISLLWYAYIGKRLSCLITCIWYA